MSDLDRLRKEYAERERRFAGDDRYSPSNPAYRFMKTQLSKNLTTLLNRDGHPRLDSGRVLEVGCGNGNVLIDLHHLGARGLHGIDLLTARLHQAHARDDSFALACADGQALPYRTHSFHLVAQFTAFTSILDDHIRSNLATEMQRVLKTDGVILWYDFWLNPSNPQTRGIRPREIRHLFPDCTYEFRKITLAPPLARRVVPISWELALFLEGLRIFNTHFLATISPKRESSL